MSEHSKLDYIQLALRVCDLNVSANVIDLILRLNTQENNLKNLSLKVPKNKLVVLTGISGSGKSTLAFDTLQKECQRQYMASLGMVTDFMSKPMVGC